jgi:hypothetical protein
MKPELVLSLTGTHLVLQAPGAGAAAGSLGSLLARLGRRRRGDVSRQAPPRMVLPVSEAPEALRYQLQDALDSLRAQHQVQLARLNLRVRLGLAYAHVGVMTLTGESTGAPNFATCKSYTDAWVKQMLHLEPGTQVIRWQVLEGARKLLISCVDRHVLQMLKDVCGVHGLRFVSCRPAVLDAMTTRQDVAQRHLAAGGATLAWIEPGNGAQRASTVQLLGFDGRQVVSAWRGWLPPPAPGAEGADDQLEGAIRRFQFFNASNADDKILRLHWPLALTDAALARGTNHVLC